MPPEWALVALRLVVPRSHPVRRLHRLRPSIYLLSLLDGRLRQCRGGEGTVASSVASPLASPQLLATAVLAPPQVLASVLLVAALSAFELLAFVLLAYASLDSSAMGTLALTAAPRRFRRLTSRCWLDRHFYLLDRRRL